MSARRVTVAEFDARLAAMDGLISRLDQAVTDHESWHRDQASVTVAQSRSMRISVMAVAVAGVSAVAAVLTLVITVIPAGG